MQDAASVIATVRRQLRLARTQLWWSWRFGGLGPRTTLGSARAVVRPASIEIGAHVSIMSGWSLVDLAPETAPLGIKIRIGDWCTFLYDFQCNAAVSVEIQHHVLAAARVLVTDSDHIVDPEGRATTLCQEFRSAPVVIEHNCWLGQGSAVVGGVRIGHHSIVGANAVVTKDVPPCSVVVGAPARIIGSTRKRKTSS